MKYFTYMGQSSLDITDEPTIIASLNKADDWTQGSRRKTMAGERTYYRPVANEFGTLYSEILTIKLGLVKCHSNFTYEEQIAIETWLTSPLISRWLYVYDTDDPEYCVKYFGKVISTDWAHSGNGFIAVDFVFETNSPYPWTQGWHRFKLEDGVPYTWIEGTWFTNKLISKPGVININGYEPFTFTVDSDELEMPVYPIMTFYPYEFSYGTTRCTFNMTVIGNGVLDNIHILPSTVTTLDCKNLILKDEAGVVDYEEWGWDDVDNIYWPKFRAGKNTIILDSDSNIEITIEYDVPYKKVGGWI